MRLGITIPSQLIKQRKTIMLKQSARLDWRFTPRKMGFARLTVLGMQSS